MEPDLETLLAAETEDSAPPMLARVPSAQVPPPLVRDYSGTNALPTSIRLDVRTIHGRKILLEVTESLLISQVKSFIVEKEGLVLSELQLILRRTRFQLGDTDTVGSCGIGNEDKGDPQKVHNKYSIKNNSYFIGNQYSWPLAKYLIS